jgi:hypothetical protein
MHSSERGRFARGLGVAGLVGALLVGSGLEGSTALMTSSAVATATVSTGAGCASGTPYANALSTPALRPTVWWRFAVTGNPATIADDSGNGNTGRRRGTGLTFGTANAGLILCDTSYSMNQPGLATSTGFITTQTSITSPTTFTIATWVRTTALTGGRVLGFSRSSTGNSSTHDRALLLDTSGRAVFHVRTSTGNLLLTSPTSVTDGNPHMLAATLSGGTARLYVDGVQVATNLVPVTLAASYPGFWRAGRDNNVAALLPGARNQAATRQDEVTVWTGRALTAAEIDQLWRSNHW